MKTKLKIILPIIIAIIAIIIAAITINFTSDKTVNVDSLIVTAQNYLNENNFDQAIAEFNKIIELDPMNVDAYIGLAQAYQGKGDIDKAIEALKKGIEATGDQRLKDMLDKILEIPNVPNAIINDNINETTFNVGNVQEELIEVPEEMISFIVPYQIEKDGEEIGDNGLSTIYYDNFSISLSNYEHYDTIIYSFDIDNMDYNNVLNTFLEIELDFNGSHYIDPFFQDDNFKKTIEPFVSIYSLDENLIWGVKDKYNSKSQLIMREYYDKTGMIGIDKYEYISNKLNKIDKFNGTEIKYEYLDNGNIIKKDDNYGIVCEYDSNGNLIKKYFQNDINQFSEYKYDSNGKCLTIKTFYENSIQDSYEFEYYSNGNLLREIFYSYTRDNCNYYETKYYEDGVISECNRGHSKYILNGDYSINYSDNVCEDKNIYDEKGNKIQNISGDGFIENTENSYDVNEKLVKKVSKNNTYDNIEETTYKYDSIGNLISEEEISYGDTHLTTYEYDENNNLKSKVIYYYYNEDSSEDARYDYEYDSKGNRVKCTYYWQGEYRGSEECSEYIKIEIPKSLFDEAIKLPK